VLLATHSGFAAPSHADCLPKADATRPETPFSKLKNLGGGKFKKCKGWFFLAGRSTACRARRRGLVQHFVLKQVLA